MAFINQGRHIGTVGLSTAFSVESSEGGCVNYTDGGTDYTACTFTSSGILTITGTGNIDALIISGGGGAGAHGPANSEGGWFGGGGGAGGMLVTTNTEVVAGTYAVEVGAGGTGTATGNQANAGRTGNLSWITPQRVLTISSATGTFVVGEILTGGTSGATAEVISHSPSTTVKISHDIQLQGQIPDNDSTPIVEQIPYRGQPGTSVVLETTLTDLPNFQANETITGSTNSYTATVGSLGLSGISELESSVGGGGGGPVGQTGYGGGSGGGGGSNNWGATGTSLNTTSQGNRGGAGGDRNAQSGAGGGGGGAGAAGNGGGGNSGGTGGNGLANFYRDGNTSGTTIGTHIFAGGGGSAGGSQAPGVTAGGSGGGGTGVSGTVNSGGGGGTGGSASHGGSGIIVVRYNRNQ